MIENIYLRKLSKTLMRSEKLMTRERIFFSGVYDIRDGNVAQWMYCVLKDTVEKLVICHPPYLPKKIWTKE